ncbi:MAG: bifunctional oligoribonuclease/PAP phosphatase NrnA [Firmicutes bacterium]|nr:bifunctional oligoribonuclease/PAP phosphatase NrnA [Bacillota bacterium]
MTNNTMKEIAEVLLNARSVLIFPHINMDGDAAGSAAALCRTLRTRGKDCWVLTEDDMPGNLKFLDKGLFTKDHDAIKEADISICVDCGAFSRFPQRKEKFLEGKTTVCIDHHHTTEQFCDYNYIDSRAAATGELIWALLEEIGNEPDLEVGEAIFTAITTDTGNFQYSNTNKNCHMIMAKLYDWGVDTNKASVEIYENERLEKLQITVKALNTMEIIGDGDRKAAVAHISLADMKSCGAEPAETDGVIDKLRSIRGVEFAAFLKEKAEGTIRVSMRAKRRGNVADIAAKYDGGGHVKAAGCTLYMSMDEALDVIKKELEAAAASL